MYFGSTASQAIGAGAVVSLTSGRLVPATDGTDGSVIVGVIKDAIVSGDTAYATAGTLVAVEVPVEKNVVWEATVDSTAVLTNTDQGEYMDLSTDADGLSVDTSQSTEDHVFCVGFISTVLGKFILNIGPDVYAA